MKNKKTIYMWVILFFVVIGLILQIINLVMNHDRSLIVTSIAIPVVSIIILVIYFIKLYDFSKNIIIWTNIFFGFLLMELIYYLFLIIAVIMLFKKLGGNNIKTSIPITIGLLIITLVSLVWFTFVKHLRKNIRKD